MPKPCPNPIIFCIDVLHTPIWFLQEFTGIKKMFIAQLDLRFASIEVPCIAMSRLLILAVFEEILWLVYMSFSFVWLKPY